ncbi:MAG: 23S rRNA (guanosine2251-2'-O)-methyltransferase [Desulforhopalus sp.]|jgi:23S rRNA (guanosine2251-2'-O)-methyltransferase
MKKYQGGNKSSGEKYIRFSDDMLWGIHPVVEGLEKESDRFTEVIIQKDKRGSKIDQIIDLAKRAGVKLMFVESLRLTGEGSEQVRHQGVIAQLTEAPLLDFDDLKEKMIARIAEKKPTRLMVLDSLQDPHNVGAIIRSALASGAAGIIVTRERSAPLGGTAAKSSAGAMSHIDICQVTNLSRALQELKEIGFWVYGAVKDADAKSLYEVDLTAPACLIVGSEGKGIRPLVKKECDYLISIPMEGDLDSLNSSVAAGVILFETQRQVLLSLAK